MTYMSYNCPYEKCNFNCKSIYEHSIRYAKIRKHYKKSNKPEQNENCELILPKKRSVKVNWEKYKEYLEEQKI